MTLSRRAGGIAFSMARQVAPAAAMTLDGLHADHGDVETHILIRLATLTTVRARDSVDASLDKSA